MKPTSGIFQYLMPNSDYKTLFEDAPVAYLAVNTKGDIDHVNQAALNMFGYDHKEEMEELPVMNLYADGKKSGDKARRIFTQYLLGRTQAKMETQMLRKNGTIFWASLHVNIIKDHQGKISASRVAVIDITDRKKTEEKYRKLFEESIGLLCTHDVAGHVLSVNRATCQALEYDAEELQGRCIGDFLSDDTRDFFNQYLQEVLVRQRSEGVMKMKSRTGKILYWKYSNISHEENGQLIVIGTAIDITELIEREKELKKAKQQAEDSVRIKDVFLSNMSHEIRTPLNSILGFADLISQTRLDKKQYEYASIIRDSTENLITIVNDILDFSKIESGQIEFQEDAINPGELIHSVITMLSNKALMHGNKVVEKKSRNLPKIVFGDRVRLTQILINLLNNAIKFTDNGTIEVGAKLLQKKSGEGIVTIQFQVKDSGIGIPEDKLQTIFERFAQIDNQHSRKYEGVGLGLSIVQRLIELQDGAIRVKSQVGEGSVFEFELPYKIDGRSTSSKTKPGHLAWPDIDVPDLKGKRILLVDDNRMNRKLVVAYLADTGAELDVAINGKVAVSMVKDNDYDVILMDMQMPEMDGYEATRVIRGKLKRQTPIIAMTAHALSGEREKCIAAGMNEYLSKPFRRDELLMMLGVILQDKAASNGKSKTTLEIKMSALEENTLGNDEVLNELITIFREDTPGELQRLKEAVQKSDYETIRQVAHSLKSSYDMLGAKAAYGLLREMEVWASDKEPIPGIKANLNELLKKHVQVMNDLDNISGK
ncbi:MAG: PAS domain S-box protein [Flavobacteriales bacterium]|nr:PAS domain S-box protein [Flavobacteriales bacterium]MCB9449636.1 PAS domain S-box protein [Flavobacteriales bacterium]